MTEITKIFYTPKAGEVVKAVEAADSANEILAVSLADTVAESIGKKIGKVSSVTVRLSIEFSTVREKQEEKAGAK